MEGNAGVCVGVGVSVGVSVSVGVITGAVVGVANRVDAGTEVGGGVDWVTGGVELIANKLLGAFICMLWGGAEDFKGPTVVAAAATTTAFFFFFFSGIEGLFVGSIFDACSSPAAFGLVTAGTPTGPANGPTGPIAGFVPMEFSDVLVATCVLFERWDGVAFSALDAGVGVVRIFSLRERI